MLFFEEVEAFRHMTSDRTLREEAKRIYQLYFQHHSAFELNLNGDVRRRVAENMGNVTRNLFDEAQSAIAVVMQGDSFLRFKASKFFQTVAIDNAFNRV